MCSSTTTTTIAAAATTTEAFHSAHDLCEATVDYVLAHVNTVQYLIQSLEGITGTPFLRGRIKCLPAVPQTIQRRPRGPPIQQQLQQGGAGAAEKGKAGSLTLRPDQVFAGYMWRRARPDCEKGDIVLVEEHLPQRNVQAAAASTSADNSSSSNTSSNKDKSGGAGDASAGALPPLSVAATRSLKELLEHEYKEALEQTERNIRHELIHAFDDARGFVESADCTHQACSEIRAARLSGDCFVGEETKKGRFTFFQGGLQCVRRRATMAVDMNPVCRGFSERAVETVFHRCYSDYEPFAAPVYALGSYSDEKFTNSTLRL